MSRARGDPSEVDQKITLKWPKRFKKKSGKDPKNVAELAGQKSWTPSFLLIHRSLFCIPLQSGGSERIQKISRKCFGKMSENVSQKVAGEFHERSPERSAEGRRKDPPKVPKTIQNIVKTGAPNAPRQLDQVW